MEEQCGKCEYYNKEDDFCEAMECYGIDCPPLPCDKEYEADTE